MSRLSATMRSMNLNFARFKRDWAVALVKRLHVLVRQFGDHLVEDVVLVDGDDAKPPSGAAEILGVGIDADGVLRKLAKQGAEIVDECSVDVIRQQHQIGALGLNELHDHGDRLPAHPHATGIAGIDDEECLDLRVFQLLDFLVRILEAVLLRRSDVAPP